MELRLTYQDFLSSLRKEWHQGQHLTVAGPTESGKSWLAADVLMNRRYVVAISNKKRDKTIDKQFIGAKRFKTVTTFPPMSYRIEKVLFWIKPKTKLLEEDFPRQRSLIKEAISHCFNVGAWCMYFDDLFYISNTLGMKKTIQFMYTQVRSNDNTLVACVQRPFWVSIEAISQTKHLLMLHFGDLRDVVRIAECYGVAPRRLIELNEQCRPAIKDKQGGDFIWLRQGEEPVFVERKIA